MDSEGRNQCPGNCLIIRTIEAIIDEQCPQKLEDMAKDTYPNFKLGYDDSQGENPPAPIMVSLDSEVIDHETVQHFESYASAMDYAQVLLIRKAIEGMFKL